MCYDRLADQKRQCLMIVCSSRTAWTIIIIVRVVQYANLTASFYLIVKSFKFSKRHITSANL